MTRGGPKRIGDLLGAVLARRGYGQLTAQRELEETWTRLVEKPVGERTRVGSLRRGVLEILVDNAALLAELEGFRKHELLDGLQRSLKHSTVSALRFRRS